MAPTFSPSLLFLHVLAYNYRPDGQSPVIMPREIDPPTVQRDFVLAALKEGKRLDGRALLEMRNISFEFGDDLGCCECRLGKTA